MLFDRFVGLCERGTVRPRAFATFKLIANSYSLDVRHNYSITSSANNKNDSGTVRPSPLAAFKFTTKLNFVGS
jgi:hypothetical protein